MKYYTLPKRFKTWAEYEQYRRKVQNMLDLFVCFLLLGGIIFAYMVVEYANQ